jgi:rubrerythrin
VVARPTRRDFLRHAGALVLAAPAVGIVACGDEDGGEQRGGTSTGVLAEPPGGDAELLNSALTAEYAAIAAYTATAPLLTGRTLDAARRFLSQERRHVALLRRLIRALDVPPAEPRSAYDFGAPEGEADVLWLLRAVERKTIAAYVDVVGRLAEPRLRATVATIVANEAEHEAVQLERLDRWAAPSAFVAGAP